MLNNIVCQLFYLCIVTHVQMKLGSQHLGRERCNGSLVFTLVRTDTRHIINAVLQIFQCIFVYRIGSGAAQINLIIVAEDSNRTKCLHQTIVGISTHKHHFTTICLIVFHIAIVGDILSIQV